MMSVAFFIVLAFAPMVQKQWWAKPFAPSHESRQWHQLVLVVTVAFTITQLPVSLRNIEAAEISHDSNVFICLNPNPQSIWICYFAWQKGRTLRWRNYLLLSRWAQHNHKGLYKQKRETKEHVSQKEMWQWSSGGLSDEGPWAAQWGWKGKLEKARRPRPLPKEQTWFY